MGTKKQAATLVTACLLFYKCKKMKCLLRSLIAFRYSIPVNYIENSLKVCWALILIF